MVHARDLSLVAPELVHVRTRSEAKRNCENGGPDVADRCFGDARSGGDEYVRYGGEEGEKALCL